MSRTDGLTHEPAPRPSAATATVCELTASDPPQVHRARLQLRSGGEEAAGEEAPRRPKEGTICASNIMHAVVCRCELKRYI